MSKPFISEIVINNFRNYKNYKFSFSDNFNIIYGNNGVGKTNLLEAIYFFQELKSFKGVDINNLVNIYSEKTEFLPSNVLFSLFIKLENFDINSVSVVYTKENDEIKKIIKINDKVVKKNTELRKIFRITYLIPQMDQFFTETSSIRRKFLDKTASLLYVNHYETVKKYEFFLKERIKILSSEKIDDNWLTIVEKKLAESGVAIASVRNEIVEILNNIFDTYKLRFPIGMFKIKGEIENLLLNNKAINVEKFYLEQLKKNRLSDLKSKRSNFGIHKSDIELIHKKNNISAKFCSTGEQKLLLLSLIIVRCIFAKNLNNGVNILILDETTTHLDCETKNILFYELNQLDMQIFLTGLTKKEFDNLNANFIEL